MNPERAADRKEPAMFRAAAAIVLSGLKLGMADLLTVVSLNGCGNCKLSTACCHRPRACAAKGGSVHWSASICCDGCSVARPHSSIIWSPNCP